MVGDYATWLSLRTLSHLETDATGAVVFAYLKALTRSVAHPATPERIARVSGRSPVIVAERVDRLRHLGLVTSQWLGFQPDDRSRKAYISVASLNLLHETGVPDPLQLTLLYVLAFVGPDGRLAHGATQIATAVGLEPGDVFRDILKLERRELIVDGKVAPFLRRK